MILKFGEGAWEDGVEEGRSRAGPHECQEGRAEPQLSRLGRSPGAAASWGLWTSGGGGPSGGIPDVLQMFHWNRVHTGGLSPPEPPSPRDAHAY